MPSHSWTGTLRRLAACGVLLLSAGFLAAQQQNPGWHDLYQKAQEAHEQKNYDTYRHATYSLLDLLPGHSDVVFQAAQAEALSGNPRVAIRWLNAYAQMGLYKDLAAESDLASLRESPEFGKVQRAMEKNRAPISNSRKWLELPPDLIPEDISFDDSSRRFLVTSIRHRKVIWIDAEGKTGDWLAEGQDGLWAVMAIGIDKKRGIVWITTEAVPHASGYDESDKNRSALLAYRLEDRALLKRLEVPDRTRPHELGDLTIAPDGTVFVSDGKAGRVYRATIDSTALETVAEDLGSPQGPTLSPDGNLLYVADYILGIQAIDLKTKAVSALRHPLHIPVNGVDCLIARANRLIAIQNGTDPVRVLILDLDKRGRRVLRSKVMDSSSAELGSPTHGVVRGQRFYYLANTGLDNFNQKGEIVEGKKLSPSRIMYFEME